MPLTVGIVGAAVIAALFATTDRGPSPSDPIDECVQYAQVVKRCFGDDSLGASAPPPSPEGRALAAKRCVEDRARIERACR